MMSENNTGDKGKKLMTKIKIMLAIIIKYI